MNESTEKLIAAGIHNGDLTRFLMSLGAMLLLTVMSVKGLIPPIVATGFIGTIVGYWFGGQQRAAGVPSETKGAPAP